uniref:Uncharacterized protein n=1 Tax=Romanomermis culicivorax TaxID=13658 RepID=A0A915HPR3_ROMCU
MLQVYQPGIPSSTYGKWFSFFRTSLPAQSSLALCRYHLEDKKHVSVIQWDLMDENGFERRNSRRFIVANSSSTPRSLKNQFSLHQLLNQFLAKFPKCQCRNESGSLQYVTATTGPVTEH